MPMNKSTSPTKYNWLEKNILCIYNFYILYT